MGYRPTGHLRYEKAQAPRNRRGKTLPALVLAGLAVAAVLWIRHGSAARTAEPEVAGVSETTPSPEEPKEPEDVVVAHTVGEGDLPAELFAEYGRFDGNDTLAMLSAAEDVFDLSMLRIGRELRFRFRDGEDSAYRMEYDRDTESQIVVLREGDGFVAREEAIAYETAETSVRGTIDDFLYVDALDAGLSEANIIEMADALAFDIDFMTDIRVGDEFSAVFEKRTRDGKEAPDGPLLAARFINDGKEYSAYRFETEKGGGYYDAEGRALERQFLKAPLSYSRITSGFTGARLHPITKKVTAHYQIDYAAPVGTPVVASARGTVVSAGWETGWGYIVRMRHDNGYTTHYAHLSSFADGIRAGASVGRGEVVGYVGSTGWSTGPHLDYGMKKDGAPVNPLTLDLPKGPPLEGDSMAAFQETRVRYDDLLK